MQQFIQIPACPHALFQLDSARELCGSCTTIIKSFEMHAGNVFLWDRLSTALGGNAPASFLQDFLVPAAAKPAAVRPVMAAAIPAPPSRRAQAGAGGRARGRGRPPAKAAAQGQQQRAAEVTQQIAAAAESVLGTSITPSQPLMDAGLDSLGKSVPCICCSNFAKCIQHRCSLLPWRSSMSSVKVLRSCCSSCKESPSLSQKCCALYIDRLPLMVLGITY